MKQKIATSIIFIIALSGMSALFVRAQNKSILKFADEYSVLLKKFQTGKYRISIESLLTKGKAVGKNLDELESLSETDYSLLEKKMKGFEVNREEILFVEPDLKFFARLAKTRGTKADIAFFALMRQIKPDNVWAAYIEQQTDVTGCTIYGNGLLTTAYGKALQFKKNYPKAFSAYINQEIDDILQEFQETGCACGSRESVLKEFRLFIKTFPNDKNTPQIKKRLAVIKKDREFRFNCQSG